MVRIIRLNKDFNTTYFIFVTWLLALSIYGCRKFVEVEPPITSVTNDNAYSSDVTAAAVLTGIYAGLSNSGYNGISGISSISRQAGLSADEFTLWPGQTSVTQVAYYKNALVSSVNGTYPGAEFWVTIYPYVYACNSAIEGLSLSVSLTPTVKKQLLGESKFVRAMLYFYLINLYGDVPLVVSSEYKKNDTLSRSSKTVVYQQIVSDLKDADSLLNDAYVKSDAISVYPSSSMERVRPNKSSARALLSRVYLYTKDYVNSELKSSEVINNSFYSLATLNNVFLKNSSEAIWQLQPVTNANGITNTQDGYQFIIPTTGPSSTFQVYLSNSISNSFEVADQRKVIGNWINSITVSGTTYYFPYKYKNNSTSGAAPTEYLMILRLGEQYLIRAEARAQLGNISGALSDLNAIRNRAGLANYAGAIDKYSLLAAIMHERQVELFTELGHRWLDLKRINAIDSVMQNATVQKGGAWQSYQQLYPIYIVDIQRNGRLVQNPGY